MEEHEKVERDSAQASDATITQRETEAREVAEVRFRISGRARGFDASRIRGKMRRGDLVVVQTERGPEMGEVTASLRARRSDEAKAKFPRVIRLADANDLRRADHNRHQEKVAGEEFVRRAAELKLPAKLSRVDYRFDGGKAIFYFVAEDRIESRGLARDLAQKLHTRVEMRQLGPRDSARMVGGIGSCGRELCCSTWLRDFGPVTIKMAKAQGLSLHSSKLTGMCGRLKCCLRYEYDTYLSLKRSLPAPGKKVESLQGKGVVVRQILLKQAVLVELEDDGEVVECSLEDLVAKRPEATG